MINAWKTIEAVGRSAILPFPIAQWIINDFVWPEVSPTFIAGNIRVTKHGTQNRDL